MSTITSKESSLFLELVIVVKTINIQNNYDIYKPFVLKYRGHQLCFVTRLPRIRCLDVDIRSMSCVVRVWACAITGSPTTKSCPVKVIICMWNETYM